MLGSWGPSARDMFLQLCKQLVKVSREHKDVFFLVQRISVAMLNSNTDSIATLNGNVASVFGTLLVGDDAEGFLTFLRKYFYCFIS